MAHGMVADPESHTGSLPRPIRRALGRIDRRLRAAALVHGLGTAALVAALGAVAGMALDFGCAVPQPVRWIVWIAWVATLGLILTVNLFRGLTRKARALELAAVLERSDPRLGERLTGAVGLLDGRENGLHRPRTHGSPALIAALADDAGAHVAATDPTRAVPLAPACRRLALGMLMAALVTAPGVLRPDPFGTLARRFLMPWADIDRVGRLIVAVTPGNTVVAMGDDLKISAQIVARFGNTPAQTAAWLEWTDAASRRARRIVMEMEEDETKASTGAQAFKVILPKLSARVTYRVVSRLGESPRFVAQVVPPPAVASISARIEPPLYTKLPTTDARNAARIEAFEGSRVTLTINMSTLVRSVEVTWPKADGRHSAIPAALSADGRTASVALTADVSGEYGLSLHDQYGLANRPDLARRLIVRPDEPPTVAIRGADGLDEAKADDTLRIAIAARDDVAVASAELHYTVERAETSAEPDKGQVAAKLNGLGTSSARGEIALGLKALRLMPGDVVAYRVRVADNRPAPKGPNVVWSGPRRLSIMAKADPLWARRSQAAREAIQERLDALKKAAAENRHETELLRYAADAVLRGNAKWDRDRREALADREAAARSMTDQLELLARDLEDDPAFRPLARPSRQVAEVEAEAARATLDQARQADDDARRLTELRQADSRLGAVSHRLEELQHHFNALAEREADDRRLQALADRQAQVAEHAVDKADPHNTPDRARLDQLEAEQNAVKNDLDALLKKSPDLRADVLAAQADEAEALARRARAVAERQREESRHATDLSKKADMLKHLADEQRAIEDDARRLAVDVDTPLAENDRGRLNTDPIRQAVDPIERGELAQGRDQTHRAEAELRRLANDLESVPGDLKALARRLAVRQDRLVNELAEALGEARGKANLSADDRAAMAQKLETVREHQRAIAELTAALRKSPAAKRADNPQAAPPFPREAADSAVTATSRAASGLALPGQPKDVELRSALARNALNHLANDLPDPWRREEPMRKAIGEAKRAADEAAQDVDRHLRETEQLFAKEPAKAASELTQRLGPVVEKVRQAAVKFDAIDPTARIAPQRDRARRRAAEFTKAVEAARDPSQTRDRHQALRDALAAAAISTRAASERLEQKLNGQVPADDVAEELALEQQALADRKDKDHPDLAARAEDQRRLATAVRSLHVPDAPLEQAEAVRLAERAARVLERGNGEKPRPVSEAIRQANEAVTALANRLTGRQTPRARVEALARSERALNEPDARAEGPLDLAETARRQRTIAAELARLPHADDPAAKASAAMIDQAHEAIHGAGALAEQALRPDDPGPGRARPSQTDRAEARARAATALDALAARLPGDQTKEAKDQEPEKESAQADAIEPRDPELAIEPGHVARARALAQRERRLRERLQAVLGERIAPQQEIRREAVAVGHDLADLRDRARALSDRAAGPANEAAAMLGEHAPRAMDDAANQLAQGQPAPARDAQRRAAELAERGAQNAEDLAAALRADRPNTTVNADAMADAKHRPDPNALAAAREAMGQASRQLGQARNPAQGLDAMNAARQAMQGAAERLQAAADARARGQEQNQNARSQAQVSPAPGQPDASSQEPKGTKAGVATPTELHALQDLVRKKTGRKWGELPGHLRSEILQMSQGRYRDDYARLIQLYFREIAAGAEADAEARP